jgi:drug/metabolite transporter (DMT)-like permease
MSIGDFAIMVVLGAIWGGSFLFIRMTTGAFGPLVLMEYRVAIAGIALLIYAAIIRQIPDFRANFGRYLILGAFNAAIPFTLIALSQLHITASLGAIVNATTPLFTALVAAIWIGERLTPKKVGGILMGIAGVGILVGWSPIAVTPLVLLSFLAAVTASLCYGIGVVYAKRHASGESALSISLGQLFGATLLLAIPALISPPPAAVGTVEVLALLALALLCTSFALLLYFYLVRRVGPTRTTLTMFLVPVFATLWGAIFLQEPISLSMVVGLATILLAIFMVTGIRLRAWLPARPGPTSGP